MNEPIEDALREVHIAVGERLRYIRKHHPEGPFTLAALAERSGVSQRTLGAAEAATANLTLESLVKIASCLGINRVAYFVDAQVFDEVNTELDAVSALRAQGVRSVALRSDGRAPDATGTHEQNLATLLQTILASASEAVRKLPQDDTGKKP